MVNRRIRSKVSRKLSRKNGDTDHLNEKGLVGNHSGFDGRIIGTVGYCNTCHRPVLSSVFHFVYCGFCNSYQMRNNETTKIYLGDDEKQKKVNLSKKGTIHNGVKSWKKKNGG